VRANGSVGAVRLAQRSVTKFRALCRDVRVDGVIEDGCTAYAYAYAYAYGSDS